MIDDVTDPLVLVVFGARGDLARRMLLPSLYRLAATGRLPDDYAVIGSGRTAPDSDDEFRDSVRDELAKSIDEFDGEVAEILLSRLTFQAASDADGAALAAKVRAAQSTLGEHARTLIYMSVPPKAMKSMITMLGKEGIAEGARLIVEKPFGTDLDSSRELAAMTTSIVEEDRVYRIDHFLGKEAVQNILALRFANGLLEPAWDRRSVESVQIDVPEDIALEGRDSFYEATGCFRDMVSTHLCQVLGFLAMEWPSSLDAVAVRDQKARVFEDLRPLDPDRVVFGQYAGYRDEDGVADDSEVETFVAVEAFVDNDRWRGVPFYLRTGKALAANGRTVTLTFRTPPRLFPGSDPAPNELVLDLTSTPVAVLELNVKRPGPELTVECVGPRLELTPQDQRSDALDAYERLLLDVMHGDQTLFARSDEVDRLWQVCQPVLHNPPRVQTYEKGSWGPESALKLPGPRGWRLSGG